MHSNFLGLAISNHIASKIDIRKLVLVLIKTRACQGPKDSFGIAKIEDSFGNAKLVKEG
jgi:hypothetical protein